MVKIAFVTAFLFCFIIDATAQFNTIYSNNQQLTENTDKLEVVPAEQVKKKTTKRFLIKGIFMRLGNLFKNNNDTIPSDPILFSYDKTEKSALFIFTEEQEKQYLDSLKMELINKRHEVLTKRKLLSLPMDNLQITSRFGYRTDPFTNLKKFHNGIDFRARNNFVYPILPGVVTYAGFRGGYGYCIEVKHVEMVTLYAHLSYILVIEGQIVPAGEPIGISGTSGRSTGEHLHFSVIRNGKFINPAIVLEYILEELTDRNYAKENPAKEKKRMEVNLENEKQLLKSLQSSETIIEQENRSTTIVNVGSRCKTSPLPYSMRQIVLSDTISSDIRNDKKRVNVFRSKGIVCNTDSQYVKVKNENGEVRIHLKTRNPEIIHTDSTTTIIIKGPLKMDMKKATVEND